ncbi:stalk domain-containing protein [Brevibacillus invocatus]|nr:stalk domain-containing protein [Brevibacillus invocatus]
MKNKKAKEALKNLEDGLQHHPKSQELYKLLSKLYAEQGDTQKIKVFVEGKKPAFDVEPYLKDGRNLVPVRAISEALGSDVSWNADSQTVVIKKNGTVVELPLGSTKVKVNGEERSIDSTAELKNGRIMVPVRFISEFLGQEVEWDSTSKIVIIKSV